MTALDKSLGLTTIMSFISSYCIDELITEKRYQSTRGGGYGTRDRDGMNRGDRMERLDRAPVREQGLPSLETGRRTLSTQSVSLGPVSKQRGPPHLYLNMV